MTTEGSKIDDYHAHDDNALEEAKKLAIAHWNYVRKNIDVTVKFALDLAGQNYVDSFIHGFAHGIEYQRNHKEEDMEEKNNE